MREDVAATDGFFVRFGTAAFDASVAEADAQNAAMAVTFPPRPPRTDFASYMMLESSLRFPGGDNDGGDWLFTKAW